MPTERSPERFDFAYEVVQNRGKIAAGARP